MQIVKIKIKNLTILEKKGTIDSFSDNNKHFSHKKSCFKTLFF